METQIKFVVIGHHSREQQARALAYHIGPSAHVTIDRGNHGANWNHRRALEWAVEQDGRVVIIEDDAMPVRGFVSYAAEWLMRFPEHIVSFYLGTGRPPQYQSVIAQRLIEADKYRWDCITLPRLIHGVCYSVPPQHIERVLTSWDNSKPADYAVGDAFGGSVIYPCDSLVDHADGEPVERHSDGSSRTERRKAWRLHG